MEGEEIDIISKLPDNLIHEILSFIDMKYVVQTCVLSKRWKNIWMSLPYITSKWSSFREGKVISKIVDRFLNFVDKVFELRDVSNIQMIHLGFIILDDISVQALNRWILAAVNHNVQDLSMCVNYCLYSYEIPHQLLNSNSLKSLSIIFRGLFGRHVNIVLPKLMSLSQIKTLLLGRISISNSDLQMLFSSCPLMEEVIIRECDIQKNNKRNIIINSHSLRACVLIDNRRRHLGSAVHSLTYTTKISAPKLVGFKCTGLMTDDFPLENLSSLLDAQFNMRLSKEDETAQTYSELPAEEKEVFAKRMMKHVGEVHNVQRLTLSSGFLEVLSQAPGALYRQPPQLCNLEVLKLEMRFTSGCLRSIAYLLKISPIITTLKLKSKEPNLVDVGNDWETGFSMSCMFSHLKVVEIREVEGCTNELKFLRFLLKKSTVLEKVYLFFRSTSDSLDGGKQETVFTRNLRTLPTTSSSIQMHLLEPLKMTLRA